MEKEFERLDKLIDKEENGIEKKLLLQYKQSLKTIQTSLADIYAKYSVDGKLSMSDLQVARRYENLLSEINFEIARLTGEKLNLFTYGFGMIYEQEYLSNANILQNEIESDIGLSFLSTEQIENAVDYRGSGVTIADRVEKHGNELVFALRQEITQGIILGKSYSEMTKSINNRLGMDMHKSHRIIRTESNRIRNQARLELYQAAADKGIEMMKEWRSAHDSRTRKDHQKLDGQRVALNENFKIGRYEAPAPQQFGVAKQDVNCRCRVRMVSVNAPQKQNNYMPKETNPNKLVNRDTSKSRFVKVTKKTI